MVIVSLTVVPPPAAGASESASVVYCRFDPLPSVISNIAGPLVVSVEHSDSKVHLYQALRQQIVQSVQHRVAVMT